MSAESTYSGDTITFTYEELAEVLERAEADIQKQQQENKNAE